MTDKEMVQEVVVKHGWKITETKSAVVFKEPIDRKMWMVFKEMEKSYFPSLTDAIRLRMMKYINGDLVYDPNNTNYNEMGENSVQKSTNQFGWLTTTK